MNAGVVSPGGRSVLPAAGTRSVAALIGGEPSSGRLLGLFRTAAYLQVRGDEVIAVLTHDAVRLPCGLVLAQNSRDDPLDGLAGPILVGNSQVSIGSLTVRLARTREAMVATGLSPHPEVVAALKARLEASLFSEHDPRILDALAEYEDSAGVAQKIVDPLVGAGTGLTPSGDDILAGFLVAARAIRLPCPALADRAILRAKHNTTTLSAALLRYASRGETIPQVARLLHALSSPATNSPATSSPPQAHEAALDALTKVLAIGHTSGTAMATGVLAACRSRLRQSASGR